MADTLRTDVASGIQPTIDGMVQEGWDKSLSIARTLPTSAAAEVSGHEHVIKVSDVVDITFQSPTGNLASGNIGVYDNSSLSNIRYVTIEKIGGKRIARRLETEAEVAILQQDIVRAGQEAAYEMEKYLNAYLVAMAKLTNSTQVSTLHRTTSGTPANSNKMSRAALFSGKRGLPLQYRQVPLYGIMGPEAVLDWDQQQTSSQLVPGDQFATFRQAGNIQILENVQARNVQVQSNDVESQYFVDPRMIYWNFEGPTIEGGIDSDVTLDKFAGAVEFRVGFKMAFWTPHMTIDTSVIDETNPEVADLVQDNGFDAVNITNAGFIEQTVNTGYVPS